MSKILLYVLFATGFLIVGVGAYFFLHRNDPKPFACAGGGGNKTIVAFGDSLVAGYGAPDGHGFVDDLATALGRPIQNFGVSGDTTAMALARVDAVIEAKPGLVILLIGGNDALQKKSLEETTGNIDSILAKLTAADISVVLIGIQGGFLSDPYTEMFSSLSEKYHTAYVPSILSGIIGHDAYMSDEVHPNAAGYQKMADKILPIIGSFVQCII